MKMGNRICMCLSSSKASTSAKITDSSIWFPQPGQHISIRTFRELNPAPMSSPTLIRTETQFNGGNSRSTEDLLEEVSNLLMTHTQRH
ncbi:AC4 [Tomato yellow margin leaf curl virus]|uniref:AC4 n=1 Tax=Tomato yellow margin leaf curl virus TaxID=260909 RepID=Q6R7Q7_9GEMI|nr:AC4 [Tomato yellow margin leaf curl virus]AAR95978.1 AC4 [Tomato yellow margin leaf curl virus]